MQRIRLQRQFRKISGKPEKYGDSIYPAAEETSDIALNKDTIQENHSDVILCSDATECADF